LSSFRYCFIEFENPESALAAKQDLDQNPDIFVSLRRNDPDFKVDPETLAKWRENKKIERKNAKLAAKIRKFVENSDDPRLKISNFNPVKKSLAHPSKKKSSAPKDSETEGVEELPPVEPSRLVYDEILIFSKSTIYFLFFFDKFICEGFTIDGQPGEFCKIFSCIAAKLKSGPKRSTIKGTFI
jgi:hypothetical protein